jgi:steroid delta-isomerase-like uncharacterized protein
VATVTRFLVISAALVGLVFGGIEAHAASPAQHSVAQKWVVGWNSADPQKLVDAFTPDAFYQDVPSDSHYKGSSELRELHKSFHDAVGGLYVKLVAAHVSGRHGAIEWIFGGTDMGLFKTGKPFSIPGVSVIEVRKGRISRNLGYYDMASIMKQVGVLPAK